MSLWGKLTGQRVWRDGYGRVAWMPVVGRQVGETMDDNQAAFDSIDGYIATFPEETQQKLQALRATIRAAAPDAVERISYQIPTFTWGGDLVHFAAFKNHIGLYPGSSGVAAFQEELSGYTVSKGTVRFPLDEPLPLDLVSRIVAFRVNENQAKAAAKGKKLPRRASDVP